MDKQHILDEIRRTAASNGGKPLGKSRFTEHTGITEAEWSGVYWARWNDAVKEAGFAPNAMRTALDDQGVVLALVGYVRKLKRFPVASELKLARRADHSFPSETVFRRKGSKRELIGKAIEFCRSHAGYDDVLAICEAALGDPDEPQIEDDDVVAESSNGFVYLLKAGAHYKIGRKNSFTRRERELAIQLPQKADTVHVIATDDPPGIEAYWHNRFADKRKNGEWFVLTAADVKAFKRRKFM